MYIIVRGIKYIFVRQLSYQDCAPITTTKVSHEQSFLSRDNTCAKLNPFKESELGYTYYQNKAHSVKQSLQQYKNHDFCFQIHNWAKPQRVIQFLHKK